MGVRVFLARAAEGRPFEFAQPEVRRIECGMLAGQDDCRRDATRREGISNRLEFDGFGPGPDDQPDIRGTQPSP